MQSLIQHTEQRRHAVTEKQAHHAAGVPTCRWQVHVVEHAEIVHQSENIAAFERAVECLWCEQHSVVQMILVQQPIRPQTNSSRVG